METHRSLKIECSGSILGGRQFFILISSVIYIFSHFLRYKFPWEFACQQLAVTHKLFVISLLLVMFSAWTIQRPFKFGLQVDHSSNLNYSKSISI